MEQGIERLPLDRAQPDDLHAAIRRLRQRNEWVAVEYRDLAAALHKPDRELLDEGLESAVAGGNPTGPEEGDFQRLISRSHAIGSEPWNRPGFTA